MGGESVSLGWLLGLLVAPGSVFSTILILWVRKKLRIGEAAANAVAPNGGPKPADYDQALILLAARVEELTELKVAFPMWVGFGRRGWARAVRHGETAEPEPPMPRGIEL